MSIGQVWSETQASSANAANDLEHAAEAGRTHIVTGLTVSFTGAAGTLVLWELRDGTDTGTVVASGGGSFTYAGSRDAPLCAKITRGNAVTCLVAAGGASVVSRVNMIGVTV